MAMSARNGPSGAISWLSLALALLLACCWVSSSAALGVVSFDYGADSLKTALIKPGMSPDVVLTRDSKRKLPSVVAWKGEERAYGTDASNLATRYPGDTFPAAKLLLGRSASDSDVSVRQRYESILNATLSQTPRGSISAIRATDYTLNQAGPDIHTAEELVAMQLSHAKMLAEETAGEKIRVTHPGNIGTFGGLESVVTVPSFWTASERQAIYDAATLAGLKPRLVSDAAAAATSFALTRNFATPELHVLYDSGHSATRASLVRFSTKSFPTEDLFGSSMKEHTFIEVLSSGWTREAGGLALDELLRGILVNRFKEQNPQAEDITKNPRAMAKLLQSASKAKQVLSANSDARVSIEGLVGDVDFRASLTRDEFEDAIRGRGLDGQFSSVIDQALQRGGGVKLSDLSSVILLGGNSRVPIVHKALASAGVSSSLIAQNLNADEAMALGAGFYGASFSPQLKMKPLRIADINAFPIVLREETGKEEVLWQHSPATLEEDIKTLVYDGQVDDFSLEFEYGPEAATDGKLDTFTRPLVRVSIEDIDSTLRALKSAGDLSKVDSSVNVTIVSQPSGTVSVQSAWLTVKPKKGGVVGALRSFFGGSAKSDEHNSTASANGTEGATAGNETTGEGTEGDAAASDAADALHDKQVQLTVKITPLGIVKPMGSEEQNKSKDKLYLMDATARRKLQKEEYRNRLESYVYRMRELAAGGDTTFEQSSKAEERAKIESGSKETADWLGSPECESSTLEEFKSRLSKLEGLVKPIEARMVEAKGRVGAEKRLRRSFEITREFLTEANANLTAAVAEKTASRYARTDLDSLQTQMKNDESWFERAVKAQQSKKQDDEPAWKVDDADKRAKRLTEKVSKLKKRRIPKTRPSSSAKKASEAEASSSATSADSEPTQSSGGPKHEEL